MPGLIFLGTDLHGPATELAAKTVNILRKNIKESKTVSISHRKSYKREKNIWILPRLLGSSRLRKVFQALLLPAYLTVLRALGYDKVATFWVANKNYHKNLFRFLRAIGFRIIFTVISGEDTNFSVLNRCNVVVCQSKRMEDFVKRHVSKADVSLIHPSVDLKLFKPGKKTNDILIPSVPYDVDDFNERGIDVVLEILKNLNLSTEVIFRSENSYKHVKAMKLKNVKLINRALKDRELSEIMARTKIIPLFYLKSPDMPYSAIEGMASGCAIICTKKTALSELVEKENAGIVVSNKEELKRAIFKILKNKSYNINARKAAEKYFDSNENIQHYLKLLLP